MHAVKQRIYVDVNVLIHLFESVHGALKNDLSVQQQAFQNLLNKTCGGQYAFCMSFHQVRVLSRKCRELGLVAEFSRGRDFFSELVKRTGGVVDVIEEPFELLNREAKATGDAPDGEDLGHLRAMRRMNVDVFVTDDHPFAEVLLSRRQPIAVVKEDRFVRLASKGRFTHASFAAA